MLVFWSQLKNTVKRAGWGGVDKQPGTMIDSHKAFSPALRKESLQIKFPSYIWRKEQINCNEVLSNFIFNISKLFFILCSPIFLWILLWMWLNQCLSGYENTASRIWICFFTYNAANSTEEASWHKMCLSFSKTFIWNISFLWIFN